MKDWRVDAASALEHDVAVDAGNGRDSRDEDVRRATAREPAEDRVAIRRRLLLGDELGKERIH